MTSLSGYQYLDHYGKTSTGAVPTLTQAVSVFLPLPLRDGARPDAMQVTQTTIRKYYGLGGKRVALRESVVGQSSVLYWLFADHLGSTSQSVNASTGAQTAMRYAPFGEARTAGQLPTDRTFTGQRAEGMGLMDYSAGDSAFHFAAPLLRHIGVFFNSSMRTINGCASGTYLTDLVSCETNSSWVTPVKARAM